jgi:hypothetical protein
MVGLLYPFAWRRSLQQHKITEKQYLGVTLPDTDEHMAAHPAILNIGCSNLVQVHQYYWSGSARWDRFLDTYMQVRQRRKRRGVSLERRPTRRSLVDRFSQTTATNSCPVPNSLQREPEADFIGSTQQVVERNV